VAGQRANILVPLGTAVGVGAIHVATMAPGLVGGDTPEMVTAAHTLGIPHQPGYPLYVVVGRLLALMPLGDPVARITILSVLGSALAAAVAVVFLRRLGVSLPVAAGLALGAALSRGTWSQAVVAEVYTLGLGLALTGLLLVDRWRTEGDPRLLWIGAYVGGLAVSHQPLMVWCLPAVLALVARRVRSGGLAPSHVGVAMGAFIVPFTLFVLLPLRSVQEPAIDYARISSAGDFFYHALGVASRSEVLSEGRAGLRDTGTKLVSTLTSGLGPASWVVLAFGAFGIAVTAGRDKERLLLLGTPMAGALAFAFVYAIHDVENYFLLPSWILILFAGVGLAAAVRARPRGPLVALLVAALVPLCAGWANRTICDRHRDHVVDDLVVNVFDAVPEGGILALYTETLVGPFLASQVVRGVREDVLLLDLTGKVIPQELGFRGMGGDWREGRWRRLESLALDPPPDWQGRHLATLQYEARDTGSAPFVYRRRGLTHALVDRGTPPDPYPDRWWSRLELRLPHPDLVAAERTAFSLFPVALRLYADLGLAAAEALLDRGDAAGAIPIYRQVLDVAPASVAARSGLALAYTRTGQLEAAEERLLEVIARKPDAVQALNALGVIVLGRGDPGQAESLFRQALDVDPAQPLTHLNLGSVLVREPTRVEEGRRHLRAFLELAPHDPDAPRIRSLLEGSDTATP
jgi:cytochrome c-type biogenesis protein CcmH/NrfG